MDLLPSIPGLQILRRIGHLVAEHALGPLADTKESPPFVPPTTWTGRMMTAGPCNCQYDPATMDSVASRDPLVAASFHNLSCSPLCRLPEELLLDIMLRLDILSIISLRLACRLFLRLFHSNEFSHAHLTRRPPGSYFHWYPVRAPVLPPTAELLSVLQKDLGGYCEDCRTRRTRWTRKVAALSTTYLHCSACGCHHPTGLFSPAQRRAPPATRICIGHEGYFRICNHLKIRWADLASDARALSTLNTKRVATIDMFKCEKHDHADHQPQHHKNDPALTARQSVQPTASIRRSLNRTVHLRIQWLGHLAMPEPPLYDSRGYSQLATPTQLHRQLQRFRASSGTAEYLAPELPPGRLTEMNCFDPNRCSCLRYDGRDQIPGGWRLTNRPAKFLACRERPACRLPSIRHLGDVDKQTTDDRPRIESHHVGIETTGRRGRGHSTVKIDIEPCSAQPSRCLQIHYTRLIGIRPESERDRTGKLRVTWAWCQALDPNSYGLTDDEDGFGILWCRQRGCQNYYRYLRPAFFPVTYMHRECAWPCSGSR